MNHALNLPPGCTVEDVDRGWNNLPEERDDEYDDDWEDSADDPRTEDHHDLSAR